MSNRFQKLRRLIVGLGLLLGVGPSLGAVAYGPSAYASFADSPFNGRTFDSFTLEDFSDGLTAPGVISHGDATTQSFAGLASDGNTLSFGSAWPVLFFLFPGSDASSLPTHAGLVWTFGGFPRNPSVLPSEIVLWVLDAQLSVFAEIWAPIPEDHQGAPGIFFGAENAEGIGGLLLFTPSRSTYGINVDHLQYGRIEPVAAAAVPEPGTALLVLIGAILVATIGAGRRPVPA